MTIYKNELGSHPFPRNEKFSNPFIDLKSIFVYPDDTINDAIALLSKNAKRIVLVVNQNEVLQGTITDGDIRRALIKKLSLDSKLKYIMNSNPVKVSSPYSREEVLNEMASKDLLHMPIVDNDGVLTGLETLQHLLEKPSYDNPVFLMAGGFGTRLESLTKNIPKPLLNVGNKPLLETILIQFIDAGFSNFFISTHYKSEMIKKHFGDGTKWDISIKYIEEEMPLGTAGALGLLPDNLPDLPILMMNGDLLTKIDFEYLLHYHNNNSGVVTMCVRKYDFKIPYGVVDIDEAYVVGIKEKPLYNYFVNAGIYVIDRGLIKNIKRNSRIDMPDFISQFIGKKHINAFPIHEYWLDIGHRNEYERANYDFNNL